MVRNWNKSAENSSGRPKLRVTRDGSRVAVTNYAKNHKRVVILDGLQKSCPADVTYRLNTGQKDYLTRAIQGGELRWIHLTEFDNDPECVVPRARCERELICGLKKQIDDHASLFCPAVACAGK
jgi:hypothetical protein